MPKRGLYDNMKTVVIERDAYAPKQYRFQPGFLDFAGHYGFQPELCRPYRAKIKGKVERMNGYLRRSFYVPLVARLKSVGLELDVVTGHLLGASGSARGIVPRLPRQPSKMAPPTLDTWPDATLRPPSRMPPGARRY